MTQQEIRTLQQTLVNEGYLSNRKRPDGSYYEVDGIYGDRTRLAHQNYQNSKVLSRPEIKSKLMSFGEIGSYENEVNKKSNEDIIHYYHNVSGQKTPYIIDDKVNDRLKVYVGGQLVRDYPAIHGKNSKSFGNTYKKKVKGNSEYVVQQGDALSVIAKKNNVSLLDIVSLNNISNPNLIKPGQVIKLPGYSYLTTDIDPDEMTTTYVDSKGKIINLAGNLTTPAGVYYLTRTGEYHGAPAFIRRTLSQMEKGEHAGIPSSIHARTIKENANTNGCTGISQENLKDLGSLLQGYDNVPTYVLPANPKNKFKIRNGELQFSSLDISKTPSHNTMNFNPISKITYTTKDLDDHLKLVIKGFSQGIINNKKSLQTALGINNDTYNQLAHYALGILGVESNYGKQHDFFSNSAKLLNKAIGKVFGYEASSPDVYTKEKIGLTDDNNSVGLTQIRFKWLSDREKELFNQFGITKESLLDPEKAAIATMIKLGHAFKNQGNNFDKAVGSWNSRGNYVLRVKGVSQNRFNIFQNYVTAMKLGGSILNKIFPKSTMSTKLNIFKNGGAIPKFKESGVFKPLDIPTYEGSFGNAFTLARMNKSKSFIWKGNIYNTNIDYGEGPSLMELMSPLTSKLEEVPQQDDYNTLRYNYLEAIENPTREGFNEKTLVWTPPSKKGFDSNLIGIGLDMRTNKRVSKFLKDNGRLNNPWLSHDEMVKLQNESLQDLESILDKRANGTPLSNIKRAIAIGLMYHGFGPFIWKPNGVKSKRISDAFYNGTDKDLIDAVTDFYKGKYTVRSNNHSKFWNK